MHISRACKSLHLSPPSLAENCLVHGTSQTYRRHASIRCRSTKSSRIVMDWLTDVDIAAAALEHCNSFVTNNCWELETHATRPHNPIRFQCGHRPFETLEMRSHEYV